MGAGLIAVDLAGAFGDRGRAWFTFFGAMVLQSLPFLVLGVLISSAIHVVVPQRLLNRLLNRRPEVAIPVAAACGIALPGCECSAVPVATRLSERGVPFSAAMAFALASPAVNPVVLAATATAFPGEPRVVLARFIASFFAVLLVSAAVHRSGITPVKVVDHDHAGGNLVSRLTLAAQHDLLHTGGYLVVGAALVATLKVVVPASWIGHVNGSLLVALPVAMLLAIVLSICSEADAFVAASLIGFPVTARLAFMVVGPLVDVRLATLYRASFGGRATRTIVAAGISASALAALVVGTVLL